MTASVVPLQLGRVTLPPTHPRSADGTCPILGHAIEHPDGVIVVDTGPRAGHPVIDELYEPEVVSLVDALNRAGIDERDVVAIVLSHLHFDHCGQHHLLASTPVWTTAAEVEAAGEPGYTVPEWAAIEADRLRIGADGEEVAEGVRVLHTPGHTPGHQSVAVDGLVGTELLVGQACYSCAEFEDGGLAEADLHDGAWLAAGRHSLERLRSLDPVLAHFSHDPTVFQRTG